MTEDYKEEAKRFLENRKQYDGSVDHFEKGDFIQRTSDLMGFFHLHMLEATRYHPDTLEPVEKPEQPEEPYLSDNECDVHIQWQIYLDRWNNALTLEQVFERYKEMREKLQSLEPSSELQTKTTHVVIDGELVPIENITVERIK